VDAAVAGGREPMRRWFVVVQLYTHALWREYPHEWSGTAFKFRRDAERKADKLRKWYANPQLWNVSVARRTVK